MRSGSSLVDGWFVPGQGDWFAFRTSSLKPGRLSKKNLVKSLFRCITKSRTVLQVRDICDISLVFFAVEDIDVIVFHGYSHPCKQIILPRDIRSNPRSCQLIILMAAPPALYLFRQSGHSVIWVHLLTVHRPRTIFGFQPGSYVHQHPVLPFSNPQFSCFSFPK